MICSFAPIVHADSEILILGTMPGALSLAKQEYYAHPQNQFWKLLSQIFGSGESLENFQLKKKFLAENHIAVWDVLESCEREGSLDSNIKNAKPNDIPGLIAKYPKIKAIIFNGKESQRLFFKNFGAINLPQYQMPSTSPAYTLGFEKKLEHWKILLNL